MVFHFLNWIKVNPEIPVLMISGHGTVEIAVNAIKAGAYDLIEKPLNLKNCYLWFQEL